MKARDKEYLKQKLKTSIQLLERGKKTLLSAYTNGIFSEFEFLDHGNGSKVYDVDGNEYIDYTMGIGPLLLGHAHPVVVEAALEALAKGNVHGLGNTYEVKLAELMLEVMPGIEGITFVNSGNEATLYAIMCARAATGKLKIAKFEGTYHGTHDYAQISSRNTTEGPVEDPKSVAEFAGISKTAVDNVITLSINRKEAFEKLEKHKDEIACVIIEPVVTICPIDLRDFLKELREVTQRLGILLIFDEVITGLRLGLGGAAEYFGITPDISTFGKVIGGGFPVGAVGGSKKIMNMFKMNLKAYRDGKIFTTGTFSGNPVTCAAGIAVIEYLKSNPHLYGQMEKLTMSLRNGMEDAAREAGYELKTLGIGSSFITCFHSGPINQTRDVRWKSTMQSFITLRRHLCKNGVIPAETGAFLLSTEHTEEDIEKTLKIFRETLNEVI